MPRLFMKTNGFPVAFIGILGCKTDKVNFTTIGDIAVASMKPPLLMISTHQDHFITQQIREKKSLSLNLPDVSMQTIVDYCSTHSGHQVDKSCFPYELRHDIPFLMDAPQAYELEVVQDMQYLHRCIFLCEIKRTYGETNQVILYTMDHEFHTFKL